MIFKQYYLNCLAQASYLIGDESSGIAVVVDPRRDVEPYLRDAESYGLQIGHVLLTHLHADFLAGHLELRERSGATIHVGAGAELGFEAHSLRDGELLEIGSLQIQALSTPGHTPESVCYLVYEMDVAQETPYAVLTGDTMFIGDVGRPDLGVAAGYAPEQLAGWLYDSLHEKLLTLPDSTLVYPAHGAGSLCGRNLGNETVSTIGAQRRSNYALQPMQRSEFIAMMTAETPELPKYFLRTARLNREDHPVMPEARGLASRGMDFVAFRRAIESGAQLLDTRHPHDFANGHLPQAINIGLDGQYASNAGTVLDAERPVVVLAELGREAESLIRLGRIGLDDVLGFLEGGIAAVPVDELQRSRRLDCLELERALGRSSRPLLLDVRRAPERRNGHIEGDLHIPLGELEQRVGEIPDADSISIYCAGGYRSSIAASILRRAGWKSVSDLIGGFSAWKAHAGKAVETVATVDLTKTSSRGERPPT